MSRRQRGHDGAARTKPLIKSHGAAARGAGRTPASACWLLLLATVYEEQLMALDRDRLEWNQRPHLEQTSVGSFDRQLEGEFVPEPLAVSLEVDAFAIYK